MLFHHTCFPLAQQVVLLAPNQQKVLTHACFNLLQPSNLITHVLTICHVKRMQSTALEQKCLDLWLLSPATPYCNPWLWLVITIFFTSKPLPVTFCFIINGWFSGVGHWTCINAYFHKHIHDLLITLLLKIDNDGTKNISGHTLNEIKERLRDFCWDLFRVLAYCLHFVETHEDRLQRKSVL